ncbi:MAG: hypothetical protein GTO45_06220 [Candidatus Aminicenantes bacterium]|nr:hypothetical protein [Candidatus Aminicenantes bacterium]NIM78419.1 hypothetical protein [Candidatus Aminicenantes bacterium]NIN17681.1 hypothetical protein [Candidatus Aminicenantes bacterium]NIN41557.1 hypothetical protein [Candidatus Aminicenantes bacterium]NIN84331.1 hypothetical protein [Candidatus Aminicenantes bacterium]
MTTKIIIISLILLMVTPVYGWFVFNSGDLLFCLDCENTTLVDIDIDINAIIVNGAKNFLKSYSDTLSFLNHVESGENDYENLQGIVASSIESMEKAKSSYYDLKNLAASIPYDYTLIEKLKSFDYQTFFKNNPGLNPAVFQNVEVFLKSGDVKGAFDNMYERAAEIFNKLKVIKESTDIAALPKISELWRLNQMYSNALLFGQYITQLICEVKGNHEDFW